MIEIDAFVAVGEAPAFDDPAGVVAVGCGFAVGTGVGVGVGEGDADPQALTVKQPPRTRTAIQPRMIKYLRADR